MSPQLQPGRFPWAWRVLPLLPLLLVAVLVPSWRHVTVPLLIGAIGGTLIGIFIPPKPEDPLKPLGRGWQAVWWGLVGLLVPALIIPVARYFVPVLLIVILWGWMMYRYRKQRGVQP